MNMILTPSGKKKLEDELALLKSKRGDIARKIKDAKELGDLSENAEYHAAKEEQGFIEARITEINSILKSAKVVRPTTSKSKITIGSKIKVKTNDETFEYEIVGMNEADPSSGKISANSPIGNAFMGKKKGDSVDVHAPAGKIKYSIVDIL